jgi:hypothetical protein
MTSPSMMTKDSMTRRRETLFKPSPNLTDEVNNAIMESEMNGGVDLSTLEVGKKVIIKTKNTTYTVEKLGKHEYTIYGNAKYCPVVTPCYTPGSTFGGSMLKLDYVGVGMFLEFSIPGKAGVITTSRIQEVHVL